jgi:ketosteroid isomerase-like protein
MADSFNMASEAAEALLRITHAIMAAIKNKDAAALDPLLADEFIYRTHFGAEIDKPAFLASIACFPLEIVSVRGDELNVNVFGETAILTGLQSAQARGPEGELEESVVAFTDVFRNRAGRWLLVLAYGVELPSEPDEPLEM